MLLYVPSFSVIYKMNFITFSEANKTIMTHGNHNEREIIKGERTQKHPGIRHNTSWWHDHLSKTRKEKHIIYSEWIRLALELILLLMRSSPIPLTSQIALVIQLKIKMKHKQTVGLHVQILSLNNVHCKNSGFNLPHPYNLSRHKEL